MPFVAYLGAERVVSLDLDAAGWSAFRDSTDYDRLTLACGLKAISKTSILGTQFFAHHRTAGCNLAHRGESQQHLAMKRAVADHINTLPGWSSLLEYANGDRTWIADVMAVHDDGRRAAFEIQLSPQPPDRWEARTQQYFDDNIIPIWVTPLRHCFRGINIPVLHTKFHKHDPLPEDPASLMTLPTTGWMDDIDTLGESIATILSSRWPWPYNTPRFQREKSAAEDEARELEGVREETARRSPGYRVEEANPRARAPFELYRPGGVHAPPEFPFFAWATITRCWNCPGQMLVWFASKSNELRVPAKIGANRLENRSEVHRAVNAWRWHINSTFPKEKIRRLAYNGGPEHESFICPYCGRTQGQRFVALLRPEKWSHIIVPAGFELNKS